QQSAHQFRRQGTVVPRSKAAPSPARNTPSMAEAAPVGSHHCSRRASSCDSAQRRLQHPPPRTCGCSLHSPRLESPPHDPFIMLCVSFYTQRKTLLKIQRLSRWEPSTCDNVL